MYADLVWFAPPAIIFANYIRNQCPTDNLNGKTLYEVWTGKKPDHSYTRIFVTRVLVLNRDPNREKLDSFCKEGTFIGYSKSTKGYRIWFRDTKKIEITHNLKIVQNGTSCLNDYIGFVSDIVNNEKEVRLTTNPQFAKIEEPSLETPVKMYVKIFFNKKDPEDKEYVDPDPGEDFESCIIKHKSQIQ